ncbi:PREDICTED: tumor necrosis factor receptor superfamily member 27, partial [Tauraco erythrolophus]|uniref:tumor necrosis factor receptor superfamily member 27 n=1 Tax=Tauraco erythrolophus TaxID=121530 RepID=UPI000523E7F6
FYRKVRISGRLDWECIPCTKQTPSSEPQCTCHPSPDTALLALTSSALVIIVLVLLALSIIYCKRFWKSQCQRVFLRTQNFSGQRAMFPTAAAPGRFLCEEQMSGPCCLGVKNLSPCYRQAEAGVLPVVPVLPRSGQRTRQRGAGSSSRPELAVNPVTNVTEAQEKSGRETRLTAQLQVDDAQSLVTQISSSAKGLPVAELPRSLVQSLAFVLDPSLNGAKNFSHVALELGVAPQLLGRISGFEQLVTHFACAGDAVT